jgi:hypothetical protein
MIIDYCDGRRESIHAKYGYRRLKQEEEKDILEDTSKVHFENIDEEDEDMEEEFEDAESQQEQ